MKMILQVEKKYYNSSYWYTEYYLHNALEQFGYHLTRDERTADFAVTAYIGNESIFLLTSPFFDQLEGAERAKVCDAIAAAMKSKVQMYPQTGEITMPNASIQRYLYSSVSNAYNEPALIESGDSELEFEGRYQELEQSGNLGFTVVNYGGPTRGLEVTLQFPVWAAPFLSVKWAEIQRYTKQGRVEEELIFKRIGNRFVCRLEYFEILPGRNRMSALWCRTRTKYQCAEFYIHLKLKKRIPLSTKLLVTVTPFSGKGSTTTFNL